MSSTTSQLPCQHCGAPVPIEVSECGVCGAAQVGKHRPPDSWVGQTVDGKYEILAVLGVGGMGMVFRARRVLVGDEVALKVLFPRLLRSTLQRRLFRDEAIAAARLDHPNVVTVYDADLADGDTAYIAMELLQGSTLKDLIKREAPMDPLKILPLALQVCEGLEAAHQAQIVHRDLKPDNLFLDEMGDERRIKIVDFGISAMLDANPGDEERKLLGTVRYMSPEQASGEPTDGRSDLYALGVVLYEALTRKRATGRSITEILTQPIKAPNEVLAADRQLPEDLQAALMSLLARDPDERPESALQARDMLREVYERLKRSRTRPPLGAQSTQELPTSRRRSWLYIGLVLALLAGVIGGVLYDLYGGK